MENIEERIERYKKELEQIYKKSRPRAIPAMEQESPPTPPKEQPPAREELFPKRPYPERQREPIVLPFETEKDRTPEDAWREYCADCTEKGFLKTQVFTARRTFPVSKATVTVSKNFPEGRFVIATETTDESGNAPMITLPAVSKSLSNSPSGALPYTAYDMTVSHPNFNTMYYYNIPIFEGILSEQNVDLIPLASTPSESGFDKIIEKEPPSLWERS